MREAEHSLQTMIAARQVPEADDAMDSAATPAPTKRAAAAATAAPSTPTSAASSSASPSVPSSNGAMGVPTPVVLPPHALRWSSSEMELSNVHRLMSAGIGAFLTSLVVTPFGHNTAGQQRTERREAEQAAAIEDVVKTRLQAQINPLTSSSSGAAASSAAAAGASTTASAAPSVPPARPFRPTASQALLDNCSHYRLHTGLADTWCFNCSYKPTQDLWRGTGASNAAAATESSAAAASSMHHPPLRFSGALDAAVKLVRHEGLSSLWRGLSPTLLMNVPSTVVYFSVYDKCKITLSRITREQVAAYAPALAPFTTQLQTASPLVAGVFARALTTTLVSPIELVRTKSQAALTKTRPTMRAMLTEELHRGGLLSLWRGVGPTLMRDVPFSAIYWTSYEYSKLWMLVRWGVQMDKSVLADEGMSAPGENDHAHRQHMITASFLAGAGSGMMSAAITHPFDLVKTRRQIELYTMQPPETGAPVHVCAEGHYHAQPQSHPFAPASASAAPTVAPSTTGQVLRTIIAEEGYVGLLSGLSARITKIAPACAIMISSYEVAKMYFGGRDQLLLHPPKQQQHKHQHVE